MYFVSIMRTLPVLSNPSAVYWIGWNRLIQFTVMKLSASQDVASTLNSNAIFAAIFPSRKIVLSFCLACVCASKQKRALVSFHRILLMLYHKSELQYPIRRDSSIPDTWKRHGAW